MKGKFIENRNLSSSELICSHFNTKNKNYEDKFNISHLCRVNKLSILKSQLFSLFLMLFFKQVFNGFPDSLMGCRLYLLLTQHDLNKKKNKLQSAVLILNYLIYIPHHQKNAKRTC